MTRHGSGTRQATPVLDRRAIINVALANALLADDGEYAVFEYAGRVASLLGCDIGAIAIPYLFMDSDGDVLMAVASAAHRPDESALAAAAGVDSVTFISGVDAALLQRRGAEWLEQKRTYFDIELARRPVTFVPVQEHAVVQVRPDALCRVLDARPTDVAGVIRWQRRVAISRGSLAAREPEWVVPLAAQLTLAGAFVATLSLCDIDAASRSHAFTHLILHSVEAERTADALVAMCPQNRRGLKVRVVGSMASGSPGGTVKPMPTHGKASTPASRGAIWLFNPDGNALDKPVTYVELGADSVQDHAAEASHAQEFDSTNADLRDLFLWCLDYGEAPLRGFSGTRNG